MKKPLLIKIREDFLINALYITATFSFILGATTAISIIQPKTAVVSIAHAEEGVEIEDVTGQEVDDSDSEDAQEGMEVQEVDSDSEDTEESAPYKNEKVDMKKIKKIYNEKFDKIYPTGMDMYRAIKKDKQEITKYVEQRANGQEIKPEILKELIKQEARRRFELAFEPGSKLRKLNLKLLKGEIPREEYTRKSVPIEANVGMLVALMFDSKDELKKEDEHVKDLIQSLNDDIDSMDAKGMAYLYIHNTQHENLVEQTLALEIKEILLNSGSILFKIYEDGKEAEQAGKEAEQAGKEAEQERKEAKEWGDIAKKAKESGELMLKTRDIKW